jgi:hypothetical protein
MVDPRDAAACYSQAVILGGSRPGRDAEEDFHATFGNTLTEN